MKITIDIAHGSARLSCHELKSKLTIYLFFELATTKSWRRSGSVFRSVAQGLNLALPKNKASQWCERELIEPIHPVLYKSSALATRPPCLQYKQLNQWENSKTSAPHLLFTVFSFILLKKLLIDSIRQVPFMNLKK